MKKICLLAFTTFLIGFATHLKAQNQCKGYPQEQSCCNFDDGTWIIKPTGGFCYMNLGPESSLNAIDCINADGDLVKMNDGSRFCVPKGVKTINGNIVFVNTKSQNILVASNGATYKFKTNDLKGILTTEMAADIFYRFDKDSTMRATAIRNANKKISD